MRNLFKNRISVYVAGIIIFIIINIMLTAAANQVEKLNAVKATVNERYQITAQADDVLMANANANG